MIFTLVLSQIVAVAGWGHLFPWSVPAMFSQAITNSNALIELPGIIIVLATSFFGLFATVFWWKFADQD